MKSSFYLVLCVAFLDYIGVGLIFPVFSSMLFDSSSSLLPLETPSNIRGFWLGILIAMMPLAQFFSAPILGTLSDGKGRKKPLAVSLGIASIGYLIAALSTAVCRLIGLFLSRLIIGFASGNIAIVQASIADISSQENKTKNYGLYGMAMGAGFTLGPLLGGWLSIYGYIYVFLAAAVLLGINLIFVLLLFKETCRFRVKKTINPWMGLAQLKKAFQLHGLKTILLCSFLGIFGWVYFFEFVPVYLIAQFQFSSEKLGLFFAVAGGCYALSTGLLIRPLIKIIKTEKLFFLSMLCTGIVIFAMAFTPSVFWIWPLIIVICYCTAPFSPTSSALVSNGVPSEIQGEALGILGSINAAAFALAPLLSGSFVGAHPTCPMWVGGILMFLGGVIGWSVLGYKCLKQKI